MKKTQEQEEIITAAKANQNLKIQAFAGTGKSSTLAMVAEEIQEKSLLLVFNKAAQLDALKKFPDHVEVRTTHSVAYQAIGFTYQAKLSRPKGGYVNVAGTGSEIAKFFGAKPILGEKAMMSAAYVGLLAKDCVGKFEASASPKITKDHLVGIKEAVTRYGVPRGKVEDIVVKLAQKLWKERIDVCSDVLCSHDTYLKLYQLSKPKLDYRVIYLDEAQDTSECALEIFKNQEGSAKLVMVGDKNQRIYMFRGAINAMARVNWPSKPLTTTFRFGPDTSELANKILGNGSNLKSFEGLSTEVGVGIVDYDKPHTVLYRTNACLILDAVKLLSKGKEVNLEVDVKDFLRKLESAKHLHAGNAKGVKHQDMLAFSEWKDLVDEANFNGELKRVQDMVEGGKVDWVIQCLKKQANVPHPHITFTTAHKSKGREWPQVVLADDFPSNYKGKDWVGLAQGERNLLYVAATRATKVLEINNTVLEIMYYSDSSWKQEPSDGVKVGVMGMGLISADIPGQEVEVITNKLFDNYDPEHRVNAYEDFLDDERMADEYCERTWDGESPLMPDFRNLS